MQNYFLPLSRQEKSDSSVGFRNKPIAIHIVRLYYVYRLEVSGMSRTNVVLDDMLVEECQKLTGIKTRRALIDYALHEVRRHRRQRRLLELKGSVAWEGDLGTWREART